MFIIVAVVLIVLFAGYGVWFSRSREGSVGFPRARLAPQDTMSNTLSITSPVFGNGGVIPPKYTCDGERGLSPALKFSGVPEGAVSLALLADDPDIPSVFKQQRGIDSFDHWTLFNLPPETAGIAEGQSAGVRGLNSAGGYTYTGPCPPPEYEPSEHRYFFRLYALDAMLPLSEGATKQEVLDAMEGHVIESAELVGRYKRIVR